MSKIPLTKSLRVITIAWHVTSLMLLSVVTATIPTTAFSWLYVHFDQIVMQLFLAVIYLSFLYMVFKRRDFRKAKEYFESQDWKGKLEELLAKEKDEFEAFYREKVAMYGKEQSEKIRRFSSDIFYKCCYAKRKNDFDRILFHSKGQLEAIITGTLIDKEKSRVTKTIQEITSQFHRIAEKGFDYKNQIHPDIKLLDKDEPEDVIPVGVAILAVLVTLAYFLGVDVMIG